MSEREVVARWAPIEWEASRSKRREPEWAALTVEARAAWLNECEKTLRRIRDAEGGNHVE